jgi:hypothetical protein
LHWAFVLIKGRVLGRESGGYGFAKLWDFAGQDVRQRPGLSRSSRPRLDTGIRRSCYGVPRLTWISGDNAPTCLPIATNSKKSPPTFALVAELHQLSMAASLSCRQTSSRGINDNCFAEDGGAGERPQGVCRSKVDATPEDGLQFFGDTEEVPAQLSVRLKVDEHIHVGVGAEVTASGRAEDCHFANVVAVANIGDLLVWQIQG